MNQILPLLKAIMFSLILVLSVTARLNAQTKGLIVKPALGAGRAVLDPNDDGYVSSPATPPGFKFNDVQESEIPYKALPLPAGEVLGDLLRGPTDGFSDFAFLFGNVDPVYTYLSNGNLMFRFRLGGIAPNSKGYSILIDTDNRFGNTGPNADPNYNAANPGFEVEIVLATGFGVRLYNVDGVPSPAVGSQLVNLPYDQYAQKAIAYTTNGGSADYFYDFYIPFSEITSRIPSFTANTPVRMVANTVMSAQHSALAGPISDVGGIDDRAYAGNYAAAFTNIIQNIVPTPLNVTPSSSFPPLRSATPVITGTYSAGTSTTASPIRITGTSTEAAGTLITVFNNGTSIGTTTVGSNGIWTYTLPNGSNLMAGDKLTATATASGKSVSLLSEQSTVYEPAFTCNRSATPTMTCASDKAMVGTVPAGVTSGTIRIYRFGDPTKPVDGIPAIPVRADGTWGWNCRDGVAATSCNAGQGCVSTTIGNGSYYAVLIEEGKCASPRSNEMCVGKGSIPTTATPVINTSNINVNTTSISGTAVAGSTVILLLDGINAGNTTATSAGAWTVSGLNLRARQEVTVRAVVNGSCVSNPASATVLGTASIAPVVNGPIRAGATSISGTSTEPAGTVITVMVNNSSICSTSCPVVDSFGNWILSGISPALAANNTITATATAPGKSVSPLSNTITVSNSVTAPAIPVITGNYTEGATSVSGTGPNNSDINLYIDGFYLGTVRSTSTNWTVNGLSGSDIEKLLYAGGILTATSGTIGTNESAASNSMMVQCSSTIPDRTKPVTAAASAICQNSSAVIRIGSSEPGISYILRNDANTADLSSAVMGTGGEISLTSYPLTASQRIRVNAMRGESPICGSVQLNNSADITVNPNPAAFTVTAQSSQVCTGSKAFVNVSNSQTNVSYQLRNKSDNSAVGTAVAGTGGQITLETPVLSTAGSFTYYVQATSGIAPTFCGTQMSNEVTITVNRAPANDLAVTAAASAICQNSSAVIRISNSEPGISYVLRNDANTADLSAAVTGTGNQISLTSYPLSASQKIRVLARNTGSSICNSALLNNSADITVNPNPVVFTAAAQSNQVCVGSKAFINVSNSQTNVSYQLRNKSDNSAVGTAVAGTGGQITLETPVLSTAGSFTYYVQASGVAPTNCSTQSSNEITLSVNTTPSKNLDFIEGTSNPDGTINLLVKNSEMNVLYQLRLNSSDFRTPVTGNGGDIVLVSDVVTAEKKTYTVVARHGASGCSAQLEQQIELQSIAPLPVELVLFKATTQQNQIILNWATASETDNDRFEVERSQDGRTFTKIGTVKGKGTSSLTNNYTFKDTNPVTGTNYYRLRQVDFDGTFEFSKTVAAGIKAIAVTVKAYPNPFIDNVQVELATDEKGQVQVTLFDMQGRIVLRQQVTVEGRHTAFELQTQQMARGIYLLVVEGAGLNSTTKLMKQN